MHKTSPTKRLRITWGAVRDRICSREKRQGDRGGGVEGGRTCFGGVKEGHVLGEKGGEEALPEADVEARHGQGEEAAPHSREQRAGERDRHQLQNSGLESAAVRVQRGLVDQDARVVWD